MRVTLKAKPIGAALLVDGKEFIPWLPSGQALELQAKLNSSPHELSAFLAGFAP